MKRDSFPNRDPLQEILDDTRYGILTTRRSDGSLHSRLLTRDRIGIDEEGRLRLYVSRHGEALADLMSDPTVCLVYSHPEKDVQLSLCGTAQVVDDPMLTRAWPVASSEAAATSDASDVADADLVLVRFTIRRADCWDTRCKLLQTWQLVDAAQMGWMAHACASSAGTFVRSDAS